MTEASRPASPARRRLLALLGAGSLAAAALTRWRRERDAPDGVADALRDGAGSAGFERVTGPRAFEFPRDHAAHPAFRHEWWYFTGHLRDAAGREYGFQITFFRYALVPQAVASASRWRARDVVLAHFAISDIERRRFHHATRRSRAALDLAGAALDTPRVWIRDWQLAWARDAGGERWSLRAETAQALLELELRPRKAIVYQGERGYSPKSDEPGNASLYYSIPRLAVAGRLRVEETASRVQGEAWLDREWGSSALGRDQRGWDWFALQFEDGRELTFYRLRRRDGSPDPHSRGLLIARDGSTLPLTADQVEMQPERWWRSPATGLRYPVDWRVRSAAAGVDLTLRARLDAQEWPGDLRYWEGQIAAVDASGAQGLGYLELTGYT
ncbi:MAG TPA: lipocalin-like domain-containing protein [Gammaproteobacteria bacterium]|nr:lipocalin-like domain-containing protein [Gammaproteobacteria bacterium]